MFSTTIHWWKVPAAALLCLLPVVAIAAQGSAPSSAPAATSPDVATLQRYVGHYSPGDSGVSSVATVTLSGTQLTLQGTGQPPFPITPQSATHFVLDVGAVEIGIDFVTNGNGPATGLVVHQGQVDVTMRRIDDAAVAQFNAALAARLQAKTAQPGTQAAVQDWIDRMEKGQPLDYAKMSAPLAEVMRGQADQAAGMISSLGALQSLTFQGVEASGADTYLAKFLSASLVFHIGLDAKGIINLFGVTAAAP